MTARSRASIRSMSSAGCDCGDDLVSTPGTWTAVYTPLDHALWNGWTLTDLVFPFLLFAMGAAVPFALARRRTNPQRVRGHVLRRAPILFPLGLVLNAIEAPAPMHSTTFRVPGLCSASRSSSWRSRG